MIRQLFHRFVYYPFFVVVTEVSDVSAEVGVCVREVKTLLTNIHVSLAKCNVATTLRSVLMVLELLIPLQTGQSSEKAAPQFTFSKKGPYHSHKISLILLHMFAKCLIALSFSTSLGSQTAYCICIQLATAFVLHPHKTLLCPLPDLLLSLFVKFVLCTNSAFSLDTYPATSSQSTSTRATTNE